MSISDNLKQTFRHGNSVIKLIYINGAVFLILNLFLLVFQLFNSSGDFLLNYLAVPASLSELLRKAWTPLTYMFLHKDILHFFFNMLTLFWFGKIFLMYFSEKQLIGLYLLGGLLGAFFYIAAFNLFPYFAPVLNHSILLGASASIMAIILATAIQSPNLQLQVLLLGNVKLKYIAVFFVLMSVFGITSDNGGGQLSHLGGALAGYIFIVSLRQGRDLTKGISRILDSAFNVFGPRKLKVKPNPHRRKAPMNDAEFNVNKARKMEEIDKILDKIKTSGYESLTAEEKKRLFEQGNKN
ncbi:MAG TPA: rhomboid family intramembrane serine protease [Paludibacter sp.]